MNRLFPLLPSAALCATALAACGSAAPRVNSGPAALPAWRAAVACARRHGMPGVADPVLGAGARVTIPGLPANFVPPASVLTGCAAQLRAIGYTAPAPAKVSDSDMRALVRLAVCMREHGYPHWPDPNAQGEFHVRSADAGTPTTLNRAQAACRSQFPPDGWRLTVTPSGQ